MAKNKQAGKVLNFVVWLTGVLVSLSVGFAMIDGTLTLPFWLGVNLGVPMIVGWVVVITTLVSALLAVIEK